MCSPTSAQMASSTHWPSWSQAPFWWGSPKSPTTIGPSTALTISARRDLVGVAGEHVAAADAPLGAHQPGALERQQDLLEVGLGEAGALGDVAHRGGAVARRGARATAGLGRRSHLGSTPSWSSHATGRGHASAASEVTERPALAVDSLERAPDGRTRDTYERGRGLGESHEAPATSPTTPAPAWPTSCRRCSSPGPDAPAWLPTRGRLGRPGRAAACSTASAGSSSRTAATSRPTLAAHAGGPITTVAPSTTATALTLDRHRASRPASTASSATASPSSGEVLNVLRWSTPARRRPQGACRPSASSPSSRSSGTDRRS